MINIRIDKSNNCNGDFSLFLSFPYNEELLGIIRAMPSRYWDKDRKEWEVPANKLDELVGKFNNQEMYITGKINEFCAPKHKICEIPANFAFKTTPFNHQVEGFKYGMSHTKWLLGDEQGLGKTKQVIDIAVARKKLGIANRCLIICGVNGLKWNWQNEVQTHSNESAWIIGQRQRKRDKTWTIGSNKDKLEDLKNIDKINSFFLITNVESLRDADIAETIQDYCKSGKIEMVAIDEIHKCFHYDTKITTDEGELKIGDIVTQRLNVRVLSFNETTGETEWKEITDWHKNHISRGLMELQILDDSGELCTIRCTPDHKIFTRNRGWVEAQYLTDEDDICTK